LVLSRHVGSAASQRRTKDDGGGVTMVVGSGSFFCVCMCVWIVSGGDEVTR
jgi:hypothetical protein